MKTYEVTFDCLIPCQVTTTIIAKNKTEATEKIINQQYPYYKYKTKGQFQQIHKLHIKELKE